MKPRSSVALVAILLLTATASGQEASPTMRICTWNLRYASDTGPHPWSERRDDLIATLRAIDADVVATQEGLYAQLEDIRSGLPGYQVVAQGREGGSTGEHCAIFVREERFAVEAYDHYWLSDTPRVVGSNTWLANCPRMVTWALLRDRHDPERQLVVWNTHLDNGSQRARELGIRMICERMSQVQWQHPALLLGDFNHQPNPDDAIYGTCLAYGLVDLATSAADVHDLDANTYNGFAEPRRKGTRIDWILGRGVEALSYCHHVAPIDGRWASDHIPVVAEVSLPDHNDGH